MDHIFNNENILYVRDNDPIKTMGIFVTSVAKNKYVRLLSYTLITCNWAILLFHGYYAYKIPDKSLLMPYIVTILPIIMGTSGALATLLYQDSIREFSKLIDNCCYALDMGSEKSKQRIRKKAREIKFVFYVNILLILVTIVSHIVKQKDELEIFLCVNYFNETFPDHANILIYIIYALYSLTFFYGSCVGYFVVYFNSHVQFQISIFEDCIACISNNRFSNIVQELELPYNEPYQEIVFKRLKFCIKYHGFFMSFGKNMVETSKRPIGCVVAIAYILTLGNLLYLCWTPVINYPRLIVQTLTLGWVCIVLAESGQIVSDQAGDSHYLFLNEPWYTWNLKNQKILCFILTHADRPYYLGPLRSLSLDRNFVKQLIKFIWSTSAIVIKMRDRIFK